MQSANEFKNIAIVLFCARETTALRMTVEEINAIIPADDIEKIVLYLAPLATEDCRATANQLAESGSQIPVEVLLQQTASFEDLQLFLKTNSTASHTWMGAADRDIAVRYVAEMILVAKQHPQATVVTSRFLRGGAFPENYHPVRKAINFAVNVFVRFFYQTKISDVVFFHPLMRRELFCRLRIPDKEFFVAGFIFVLILLRLRVPLQQVPVVHTIFDPNRSYSHIGSKFRMLPQLFKMRFIPIKILYDKIPR
ncbi:MAG: hypothetical protein LBB67_03305 [Oscillospiraceae bacterium]|jgi:hypothetical protein|nr:hypothetical protein [Oscillospiraceae bacterium]